MSALGSLVVKLALEYAEYTKGLDKSSQESLAFAKKTQKHFDDAATSAKAFFADAAKGMLGYLGASTALDAFNVSLEKLATLDDMAQKTGSSVENLSRLQKVAEMTAFEFGNVDAGVLKLARGMGGLDEEGNKVVNALAAIDVQTKNSDGSLRDSSEVLVDVAKKLQNYKDDSAKAALATDLFGKSGADLLPYLNDVAEKVDGVSSYSTEAATNAARLQDNFSALKTRAGELSTEMSVLAMPVVLEVFKSLTVLGAEVAYVFKAVGTEIGGIAAQAAALATGDFSGAKKIGEMMKADAITAREELDKWSAGIMKIGTESEKTGEVVKESLGKTVAALNQTKEDELKLEAERKRIEDERKKRNAQALQEQQQIAKAQENFIAGLQKEFDTLGMTADQMKIYNAQQQGIKGSALEKVKVLSSAIAAHKAHEKAIADDFKASQEYAAQNLDFSNSLSKNIDALRSQVEVQRDYNERLGLSQSAIRSLNSEEIERQAIAKESLASLMDQIDWTGQLGDKYREEAKLLRELNALKNEGADKQNGIDMVNQSLREQSDMWASIDRTAHDTFISMWDNGKDAAQRLKDTFKNVFFDWLYQMTVKKWIVNLSAGVTMTASGSALASTGGMESMLNPSNLISAGQSLWQGFTAAGALGNGFWGSVAGGLQGAGAGSGLTSAMGLDIGNYLQGVLGNNVAGSLSSGISSISAAMPYAAAAIAAFQISKGINGGYRLGGLSADAGALLGIAPRLFGMQEKELGAQTITGTLGSNDLARNVAWSQKGGLFRSDRSGTWSYNLANSTAIQDGKAYQDTASLASDQALLQQLNGTYDAMKAAATDYAKALGLNASAIEQKADQINLTLSKSAEENQAAIQKTFAAIADSYASMLLPSISSLSQQGETAANTLARLATNFQTVNQGFDALGLKMFEMGEEGIKASEKFTAAVGGLQSFQAAQASFYQNFYSEEERNAELKKQLTAELQKQNLALPESRKGYRALLEEVSKTGTPEQLASLFKLNAAFASVFAATEVVDDALSSSAQKIAEQSIAIASAGRRQELLSRRADEAANEAIRQASESAFQTLVQSVELGMTDLIRAGDAGAALASQMSIVRMNKAQYTNADGGFNVGAFNQLYALEQAKASKDLINRASADALNVQNVSGLISDLMSKVLSEDISNSMKANFASAIKMPAGGLIAYAMDNLLDAAVQEYQLANSVPRGRGIASVLAAQMDLQFAAYDQGLMSDGIGADVNAYGEAVRNLGWMLDKGKISHEEYASALEFAEKAIGSNIVLVGDHAAQLERINRAQQDLVDSGLDSIAYYFGQIGKSVAELNAEAAKANAPLAQINASIGRMSSLADVFSQSAIAALSGGGNANSLSVQNAQIVAEAASRAAALMTTEDARRAATELSSRASFSGMDERQLRDVSLLLDGINQFDSRSFETAFMRMNDALNRGVLTQDQYQDMFSQSIDAYQGVDDVTKSLSNNMQRLSDSMRSFADELLIDPSRSGLTSEMQREALLSQYDRAKISAATGDTESINRFQSLAKNVLDLNYKSQAEFNAMAGIVYADARRLEAYGANNVSTDAQRVVEQLQKNNEALNKKLEDVKLILSEIMVRTGKTVDAVDRQTVTQVLNN